VNYLERLLGVVEVSVTSADPAGVIGAIANQGILIHGVIPSDDPLVSRFWVSRRHLSALNAILERRGDTFDVLGTKGLYWKIQNIFSRPIFVLGSIFLLVLTLLIPSRILFFRVEGNQTVSSKEILEVLDECGVCFGTSRMQLRSEQIKNGLLEALPQLQWAGINTTGCVATVSVRERNVQEISDKQIGVASIVASRDGVICEYTVLQGNGLCKVGQAVKAGQVLISGYTDCGIAIRATRADGEVYAKTQRTITAVCPTQCTFRDNETAVEKKFAIIIGKKRINFYKGSGISDSSCGKIYLEKNLTLPGGFQLPLTLVTEEVYYYEEDVASVTEDFAVAGVIQYVREYLAEHMIAGKILDCREEVHPENDRILLKGKYACQEMIGQVRSEEIMK